MACVSSVVYIYSGSMLMSTLYESGISRVEALCLIASRKVRVPKFSPVRKFRLPSRVPQFFRLYLHHEDAVIAT